MERTMNPATLALMVDLALQLTEAVGKFADAKDTTPEELEGIKERIKSNRETLNALVEAQKDA